MKTVTLQIDEQKARSNYDQADDFMKKILEDSFPSGFFSKSIEERASTFEAAHSIFLGLTLTDPDYLILQRRKSDELTTHDKLMILAEVWRDGWKADYNDRNQKKYYSWAEKTASGWVFVGTAYGNATSHTAVGPRFVFQSAERARKFYETFNNLFNQYLIIQ